LRAGLAEVIKYGIIYDAALFRQLERDLPKLLRRDPRALASIVARCCDIKAAVVGQDERETGVRAILNFGHTIGHALEAISRYGRFLHGEAIAIGQVAAARLSAVLAGLPERDFDRIRALFERAGLPTEIHLNGSQRKKLLAAMKLDKKVRGGEIQFVVAERIGRVITGRPVSEALITRVINGDGGTGRRSNPFKPKSRI
jgi:3-dehydroquinate synthase